MQYTLEEILDLIAEALGAIFFIVLCRAIVMGDFSYGVSRLVELAIAQVYGG